jgi:hypothetical protein
MGFSQTGFMIIVHTIIQLMSPDYVRGRIAGVYSMYVGGSMAFSLSHNLETLIV